jgi:hypothetical protein
MSRQAMLSFHGNLQPTGNQDTSGSSGASLGVCSVWLQCSVLGHLWASGAWFRGILKREGASCGQPAPKSAG